MAYKVEFAGRELHEYVTILNVNRKFPERMNFTKDISGVHGKHYIGYKYSEKINKKASLTNDDKNILTSFLLSNKIIKNKKTFKFPSISKSTINIKSDIKPKKETKNKTRNSSLNNKYNLYEEQSINDEYRKIYQMKKVSNAFSNSLLKSILMRKADDDLTKIMNTEAKNVTNSNMINPLYKGYRVIMKRCSNVN